MSYLVREMMFYSTYVALAVMKERDFKVAQAFGAC